MEKMQEEFSKLLEGEDKEACVGWALKQLDGGMKVADLHAKVLAPSLNAIVCTYHL